MLEKADVVTNLLKTAIRRHGDRSSQALIEGQFGTWLLNRLAGTGLTEALVGAVLAGKLKWATGLLFLPLVA